MGKFFYCLEDLVTLLIGEKTDSFQLRLNRLVLPCEQSSIILSIGLYCYSCI